MTKLSPDGQWTARGKSGGGTPLRKGRQPIVAVVVVVVVEE